jgi:DNA-binding MarR family transcriptional regulator
VASGSSLRELSDSEYRALATFRHALRVFLRFSEEAARTEGLTPAQHQLLLAVRGWWGPGPPAVAEVADALQLRPHSALELARRAEQAGLVELAPDPEDARRQVLHLTARGEDSLAHLSALHRDELRRFRTEMNAVLDELG